MSTLSWNPDLKLILSDVDETVADLYLSAVPAMVTELTQLLEEGRALFFITGQGLTGVQVRVIDHLPKKLRSHTLIAPCSGAEVWGYDSAGELLSEPYYSVYEERLNQAQRTQWRAIITQVIAEFSLKTYPVMPVAEFLKTAGEDPLAVMFEDRGSQITLEVVNGYNLEAEQTQALEKKLPLLHGVCDLRVPLVERAQELLEKANIPISARVAGMFAVDFVVQGVSKTTAVKHALETPEVLAQLGLTATDLTHSTTMEIWGDKFSASNGGSDRFMCHAVSPQVRAIDFREEDPAEFEPEYSIVLWDGQHHLHEGLLEFLQQRHAQP